MSQDVPFVRRRIASLLATHGRPPAAETDPPASVWEHFPPNPGRCEHLSVTAFCDAVQHEFGVFVTEEEWETATLDGLAEIVAAKAAAPERSLADWRAEHAAVLKGLLSAFVFFNLLLVLFLFFVDERFTGRPARYAWYVAAFVAVNAACLYAYVRERRKPYPFAHSIGGT